MKNFFVDKKGQSLLEIIVAMAIFVLIAATMVSLSMGGFVSMDVGGEQTEAQALAQEGVEAVRAIRDRAWNELTFSTSTVSTSSNQWVFGTEGSVAQIGNYTRTLSLENVCRDASNNIVACPGLYTDAQTKKIISQIDWPVRNTTNTVKQVSYLTNWDTSNWTQTDWVGGSAQSLWSDITKYFSDDSNLDIATTGQVQLKYTSGSGCGQMIWDFGNSGQYTFDSANLEVTGGFGQLKDIGSCSGTTSTCATYLNQTSCTAQVGCSWTASYSATAQTIRNINSYNPSQIAFWGGFTETATKNGGEIYYQLSSDDGTTWKYWNGSIWATSTLATNYNLATVVNTNIAMFSTSSKKIMFKAFLLGNGSQQVKLDQVQINCSRQNDDGFDTPANYTYDSAKITVTSSQVMLKDVGGVSTCSGTPNACNTFGTLPLCTAQTGCSWSSGASSNTTNPDFTSNSTGWTYTDWETGNRVTGDHQLTGGNPSGYIRVNVSGQKGNTISGYWYQAFTTTQNNPTATLSFDWRVPSYAAPTVTSFKIYAFVESTSGAPTIGNEVWSTTVTSLTNWASVSNLNVSSKVTTAGTYYLKLVVRVIHNSNPGTPGTNRGAFDNVLLSWTNPSACSGTPDACNTFVSDLTCSAQTGCSWIAGGASYATTSPSINPTASLSVPTTTFYGWTGFTETATTNGGSINYQLSNNDGSTWQYWNGSAWATAGAGNYNPATTINSNIAAFGTSTGKLMFKAFLTSNGSQLVQLDNIKVTWMELVGSSGYALFGSLISSAFNMTDASPANVIAWTQDVSACTGCAVKLQVRTAPNSGGTPGAWSSWNGVAGAGTYFTDYHGQMIPKALNWNQWVQYQAELTSDGITTPILKDVTVYYQ